jgi:hypothetical protein
VCTNRATDPTSIDPTSIDPASIDPASIGPAVTGPAKGQPIVPTMPAQRAQKLCETVFQRLALSDSEVADCTRAIMFATLRSLDSHGIVSILPGIAGSVKRGQTRPHAEIVTLN